MNGKDWGRERLECLWDLEKPRVVEREVNRVGDEAGWRQVS